MFFSFYKACDFQCAGVVSEFTIRLIILLLISDLTVFIVNLSKEFKNEWKLQSSFSHFIEL